MTQEDLQSLLALPVAQEAKARFEASKQRSRRAGNASFEELCERFARGDKYDVIALELKMDVEAVRKYWKRYFKAFLSDIRNSGKQKSREDVRKKILVRLEKELPRNSPLRRLLTSIREVTPDVELVTHDYCEVILNALRLCGKKIVVYKARKAYYNRQRPGNRRTSFSVQKERVLKNDLVIFVLQVPHFPFRWALFERDEILQRLFPGNQPQRTFTVKVYRPQQRKDRRRQIDFWRREGGVTRRLIRKLWFTKGLPRAG